MKTKLLDVIDIHDGKKDIHVTINGERWMTLYEPLFPHIKTSYESLRSNPDLVIAAIAQTGLMLALELRRDGP